MRHFMLIVGLLIVPTLVGCVSNTPVDGLMPIEATSETVYQDKQISLFTKKGERGIFIQNRSEGGAVGHIQAHFANLCISAPHVNKSVGKVLREGMGLERSESSQQLFFLYRHGCPGFAISGNKEAPESDHWWIGPSPVDKILYEDRFLKIYMKKEESLSAEAVVGRGVIRIENKADGGALVVVAHSYMNTFFSAPNGMISIGGVDGHPAAFVLPRSEQPKHPLEIGKEKPYIQRLDD